MVPKTNVTSLRNKKTIEMQKNECNMYILGKKSNGEEMIHILSLR